MSNSKVEFVINFFKEFCIEDVLAKRRINAKSPNSKKTEVLIHNNKTSYSKPVLKQILTRDFSTYKESFLFKKKI